MSFLPELSHAGANIKWDHCLHGHSPWAGLAGQGLREEVHVSLSHAMNYISVFEVGRLEPFDNLRGRVGRDQGLRGQRGGGGQVDNCPASPSLHPRQDDPRHQGRRTDIYVDEIPKKRLRGLKTDEG